MPSGRRLPTALGASRRQLRSSVLADAAILATCGLIAGACLGWALSPMLVTVPTGVFDPPPTGLTAPWAYLAVTAAMITVAITVVSATTVRLARRSVMGSAAGRTVFWG
jgi:putative ABC transport system permease protein